MFKQLLSKLLDRSELARDEMLSLMHQMMAGKLTPAQIAATLVALRMKGETVDEIVAAAQVIRELSTKVVIADTTHLVDTCGTGGDGIQTFNVSTVSALVAAAAGARVAKHGGRSVSSTCGSADVLEALGVNINLTPQQVAASVDQVGIGFMFAPNHHGAMKHAAPVRCELGVRTLFNLLGPLTNPASAQRQVIGVFERSLTAKLAEVLRQLGSLHVLVVHGANGMDEVSFSGDTYVAELKNGKVSEYLLNPAQFGMPMHQAETIRVDNAEASKAIIQQVLNGKPGAARDIVLLNAGAAIYAADVADSLEQGIHKAAQVIDSGAALHKLQRLVEFSATCD